MICFIFVIRYAYAVSSALHGVSNILHKDFMIQVLINKTLYIVYTDKFQTFWSITNHVPFSSCVASLGH